MLAQLSLAPCFDALADVRAPAPVMQGDDGEELVNFGPATGTTVAEQRLRAGSSGGGGGGSQGVQGSTSVYGLGSLASATISATTGAGRLLSRAASGLVSASGGAATSSAGAGYLDGQSQAAAGSSRGGGGSSSSSSPTSAGTGSTDMGRSGSSGGAAPSQAKRGSSSLDLVSAATSAAAGGAAAVAGSLSSALGWGPGIAQGEPAAVVAVGLTHALFDIMVAAPACLESENPQLELVTHIEAVLACRSLNDFGARLLDFWYAVRLDVLADWPLHRQQTWVRLAYLIKYGDLHRGPGALARCCCGLLLELGDGFRVSATSLDAARASSWATELRRLAELCDRSPPPAGWVFPSVGIAQQSASAFDKPVLFVTRADMKGVSWVKAKYVLAVAKTGVQPAAASIDDEDEGATAVAAADAPAASSASDIRALTGGFDDLADRAGSGSLGTKCLEKSDRLFNQKTKPIHFLNMASIALKICLFSEDDMFCAFPVGGVGGPCVVTLGPNSRTQLRPPGTAMRFQLKVLQPGLLEKKLYMAMVERGTSVQLRSCNCSCD